MSIRTVGQVGYGSDLLDLSFDFAKYISNSESDIVYAGPGPNQVIGNRGSDKLYGMADDDVLKGGLGRDVLIGGKGADYFVFDHPPTAGNIDKVKDFSHRQGDKIVLSQVLFQAAPLSPDEFGKYDYHLDRNTAKLASFAFRAGKQALTETDRIIYDGETGSLWYDADGSGAGAAVKIAKLKAYTNLSASDFLFY